MRCGPRLGAEGEWATSASCLVRLFLILRQPPLTHPLSLSRGLMNKVRCAAFVLNAPLLRICRIFILIDVRCCCARDSLLHAFAFFYHFSFPSSSFHSLFAILASLSLWLFIYILFLSAIPFVPISTLASLHWPTFHRPLSLTLFLLVNNPRSAAPSPASLCALCCVFPS